MCALETGARSGAAGVAVPTRTPILGRDATHGFGLDAAANIGAARIPVPIRTRVSSYGFTGQSSPRTARIDARDVAGPSSMHNYTGTHGYTSKLEAARWWEGAAESLIATTSDPQDVRTIHQFIPLTKFNAYSLILSRRPRFILTKLFYEICAPRDGWPLTNSLRMFFSTKATMAKTISATLRLTEPELHWNMNPSGPNPSPKEAVEEIYHQFRQISLLSWVKKALHCGSNQIEAFYDHVASLSDSLSSLDCPIQGTKAFNAQFQNAFVFWAICADGESPDNAFSNFYDEIRCAFRDLNPMMGRDIKSSLRELATELQQLSLVLDSMKKIPQVDVSAPPNATLYHADVGPASSGLAVEVQYPEILRI